MKYLASFSLTFLTWLLFLGHWSFADIYLRDVPAGHWANDSVYNLVKIGVTNGYPDGTFRGNKLMTRYDLASFLNKMGQHFNLEAGKNEKLLAELQSETSLLKYQKEKTAQESAINGDLYCRASGQTFGQRTGTLDYRLKLNVSRNADAQTGVRFSLDTLDAGYGNTVARPLATQQFSLASYFRWWGLNCQLDFGPGDILHFDSFYPSENYTVYRQPKTSLTAATALGQLSLSASYVARQVPLNGLIGVHELTGLMKYKFNNLAVYFQPRYLYKIDGPRDIVADFGLNYIWREFLTQILLSAGSFSEQTRGLYLKVSEKISDPFKTGTNIHLRFDKVGSKYRTEDLDKLEFVYLNNFDRLITDGTADFGLKVEQKIGQQLSLEWASDYVTTGTFNYGQAYPGTYWLWQVTGYYHFATEIVGNVFYKGYNVPSGIAQFDFPAPLYSEVIGFGGRYDF